ncbi:hypothetical protein WBO78_05175 [Bosea sp. CCNWLW174]|uniref:hypothetical protein n=1 Tax=unclassified Bosea (in: a-proteobacteria) TaxID=2653178 RepID=UPI003015378B
MSLLVDGTLVREAEIPPVQLVAFRFCKNLGEIRFSTFSGIKDFRIRAFTSRRCTVQSEANATLITTGIYDALPR